MKVLFWLFVSSEVCHLPLLSHLRSLHLLFPLPLAFTPQVPFWTFLITNQDKVFLTRQWSEAEVLLGSLLSVEVHLFFFSSVLCIHSLSPTRQQAKVWPTGHRVNYNFSLFQVLCEEKLFRETLDDIGFSAVDVILVFTGAAVIIMP